MSNKPNKSTNPTKNNKNNKNNKNKSTVYTSEDLKPHTEGVLDFKSLLASYLKNKSAVRI